MAEFSTMFIKYGVQVTDIGVSDSVVRTGELARWALKFWGV